LKNHNNKKIIKLPLKNPNKSQNTLGMLVRWRQVNPTKPVPQFHWIGMHYTNTSGTVQNVTWTDGSPVDFGNPMAQGFQVFSF
jgi:hypothetical protein